MDALPVRSFKAPTSEPFGMLGFCSMNFLAISAAHEGTLVDSNRADGQTSAPGQASATSQTSSPGIPIPAQREVYFSIHSVFK